MDKKSLKQAISALAVSGLSWGIPEIFDTLHWLPYAVVPVSFFALATIWFLDRKKSLSRKSLPGLGIHMAINISEARIKDRQYIFEMSCDEPRFSKGMAFYLSKSRRFVFRVLDEDGEPHMLEAQSGWLGVPLGKAVYLALEAGTETDRTVMRIIVNGEIRAERELPFPIDFSPRIHERLVLGANKHKKEHAAFCINNLIVAGRTLTEVEAKRMAMHQADQAGVVLPRGAGAIGSARSASS